MKKEKEMYDEHIEQLIKLMDEKDAYERKNKDSKNDNDSKIATKKYIPYWAIKIHVNKKEIKVPDQVLLGLTDGIINGPFKVLPLI